MKALLLPLDEPVARHGLAPGSTAVQLLDENSNASLIVLRHPFGLEPSLREFEEHWDTDERTFEQFCAETTAGSDYESAFSLYVAGLIVRAVNELPALLAENRRLREALKIKQASVDATPFARAVLRSIPVYDPDKIPDPESQAKPTTPFQQAMIRIAVIENHFSLPVVKLLRELGIFIVGDLEGVTMEQLRMKPNFDQQCEVEVRSKMARWGLRLAGESDSSIQKTTKSKSRKREKKK